MLSHATFSSTEFKVWEYMQLSFFNVSVSFQQRAGVRCHMLLNIIDDRLFFYKTRLHEHFRILVISLRNSLDVAVVVIIYEYSFLTCRQYTALGCLSKAPERIFLR